KVLYSQRNEVLESADVSETIASLREAALAEQFRSYIPEGTMEEQWDVPGLQAALESEWQLAMPLVEMLEKESSLTDDDLLDRVLEQGRSVYQAKVDLVGHEGWAPFERSMLLQSIDTHWRNHLSALDHLRQGIHLRGYAQKDPK